MKRKNKINVFFVFETLPWHFFVATFTRQRKKNFLQTKLGSEFLSDLFFSLTLFLSFFESLSRSFSLSLFLSVSLSHYFLKSVFLLAIGKIDFFILTVPSPKKVFLTHLKIFLTEIFCLFVLHEYTCYLNMKRLKPKKPKSFGK